MGLGVLKEVEKMKTGGKEGKHLSLVGKKSEGCASIEPIELMIEADDRIPYSLLLLCTLSAGERT